VVEHDQSWGARSPRLRKGEEPKRCTRTAGTLLNAVENKIGLLGEKWKNRRGTRHERGIGTGGNRRCKTK